MGYHVDEEERIMKLQWLIHILFVEEITEQDFEIGYNIINEVKEDNNDW